MKIDRPGAAIIGAVLMFATGAVRRNNALYLIHFGTVVLLFSMMLVVAYLHLAGFFDWVTDLVVTRLKPPPSPTHSNFYQRFSLRFLRQRHHLSRHGSFRVESFGSNGG